jgi:hypothetical protein
MSYQASESIQQKFKYRILYTAYYCNSELQTKYFRASWVIRTHFMMQKYT